MTRTGRSVLMGLAGLLAGACGGSAATVKEVERGPAPVAVARDPGLVEIEITPARRLVAADKPGGLAARVRIRGGVLPDADSPPVNLALVVDTSGSMEGKPIEEARRAAREVIGGLKDGDRLAIVVFHSTAELLAPSTVIDDASRADLSRRVGAMVARGTTDLQSGLAMGVQQVQGALRADGINRVVLLSDGVPNDASQIPYQAQVAGSAGIAITALGLGLDYDETLLGTIAQRSGGKFHYLETPAQVAAVMRDEVLSLRRVVARNASLALSPGPGVTIASVLGHQSQVSGRTTYVPLGELGQGETRDLFIELTVTGRVAGAVIELADAVLTFDDAVGSAGRLERRAFASVRASGDKAAIAASVDGEVVRGVERARAAAATVQVIAT